MTKKSIFFEAVKSFEGCAVSVQFFMVGTAHHAACDGDMPIKKFCQPISGRGTRRYFDPLLILIMNHPSTIPVNKSPIVLRRRPNRTFLPSK